MTTKHSQLYEQTIMIEDILKTIAAHLKWCESEARNAAIEEDDTAYLELLRAEDELNIAYGRLTGAADAIERADQYFAFPF